MYDEDGSLLDVGEGWAEIDPEQYAGQQAAKAEAEMDKAAAAADDAYLERQVQKNGYGDMVVMSMEHYQECIGRYEIYAKLAEAQTEIDGGKGKNARRALAALRRKYNV